MIHELIEKGLTERPSRRLDGMLWVSDLGYNPYDTVKRLVTGETKEFDVPTLIKMQNGVALEDDSLAIIAQNSTQPIKTQVPLFNDVWSGYADIVFDFGKDSVAIFDHKGSGGKWWDYKGSLPRVNDCCQVWLYGELYKEMYGKRPYTGLYYRGWGTWAEFQVSFDGRGLSAVGYITNEKGENVQWESRSRRVNPFWLKRELEGYYGRIQAGEGEQLLSELTDPGGPDWDYATGNYDRLAGLYGPKK